VLSFFGGIIDIFDLKVNGQFFFLLIDDAAIPVLMISPAWIPNGCWCN